MKIIISSRFMMAQLVATNGCLWIALVGIEAKAEAEHSADDSGNGESKNSGSRSIFQKGDNEHNIHSVLDEFPGSAYSFEKSFEDLPGVFGLERNSEGFGPWGNHQSMIKLVNSITFEHNNLFKTDRTLTT